jgi:hypothetical protein
MDNMPKIYFTLGGKLYNTSLHLPSTASIPPKSPCPHNICISSPPCRSSCDQYGNVWTLHSPASSYSCCTPMEIIGGTCNTFHRTHGEVCCEMNPASYGTNFCGYPESNICCGIFVKSCNINEDICSGMLPKWERLVDQSS